MIKIVLSYQAKGGYSILTSLLVIGWTDTPSKPAAIRESE